MSLLIADIGGTSSRWASLDVSGAAELPGVLPGYNPAAGDPSALQGALGGNGPITSASSAVEEVVVYGAGCGSEERKALMRAALQPSWPAARITVESDLLGAARGLYGKSAGLVLILGTGMNAGYYDGQDLHTPMPSLGYVLGDECSGADIGKQLLRDLLYGRIPEGSRKLLFPQAVELPGIVQAVYRHHTPQAWLASFAARLADHPNDPYTATLVGSRATALAELLAHFFREGGGREVRAVGSVALGFSGVLEAALAKEGMRLTAVRKDPMEGLLAFHSADHR
jgi:N-acetylglucosamine kinase-like BadF-type ATPase